MYHNLHTRFPVLKSSRVILLMSTVALCSWCLLLPQLARAADLAGDSFFLLTGPSSLNLVDGQTVSADAQIANVCTGPITVYFWGYGGVVGPPWIPRTPSYSGPDATDAAIVTYSMAAPGWTWPSNGSMGSHVTLGPGQSIALPNISVTVGSGDQDGDIWSFEIEYGLEIVEPDPLYFYDGEVFPYIRIPVSVTDVPEPSSIALLSSSVMLLLGTGSLRGWIRKPSRMG
jgi:hypothetical protein